MVVRPRRLLPTCLLSAVLILGGLHAAPAQNNSLFPKGNPNRTLPQATPLPRGATRSDSPASSAARRRPAPPPRPDTVALPYNLVWFDNQSRLASLFAGVGAKITDKKVLKRARAAGAADPAGEGHGEALLEAVRAAVDAGVDPELALRQAADSYREQVERGTT